MTNNKPIGVAYADPTIQDPRGADAQWCFITQDVTKEEYEREYPLDQPEPTDGGNLSEAPDSRG